jgi:hypothetical protein
MKKIIIYSCALFSCFCLYGFASAQNVDLGLSVSPQVFEMDVMPGQVISKEIKLGNTSNVPLPITIKTTDFTAQDGSGEMEFDDSMQDPAIASRKWFTFEKPDFILDVGERETVKFTIAVPADAEPGGHYSVVLFEPQLPNYYFNPSQPKVIPEVGVLFLLSVNNLYTEEPDESSAKMQISEFKIPQNNKLEGLENILSGIFPPIFAASELNIVEKKPSSYVLSVKNNDIYHHKISGKLSIYNSLGKLAGETEISKLTVLPGKSREFVIDISQSENVQIFKFLPASISGIFSANGSLGKYKAVLNLDDGTGAEMVQTLQFWALPWKTGLLLVILMIIILLFRKRLTSSLGYLLNIRRKNSG